MKKILLSLLLLLSISVNAQILAPKGMIVGTGASKDTLSVGDLKTVKHTVSTSIYIDGNRAANYTEDGSYDRPYRTISAGIASITNLSKTYEIHLTPATYTVADSVSLPDVPIVVYGNKSTITVPEITINNVYTIYDLNITGSVVYAYTGLTRSLRIGGSIVGNVSVSGFEDYESVNFSAHTVTVQANSNPLFSHCTFGSKLVSADSTTIITVNDCQFNRPTVDDYNIDMSAGGILVCKGALLYNKLYTSGGTHTNINLSGASVVTPSFLSALICTNGITCDSAYVIMGSDNISPVLTGTKIFFTTGVTSTVSTFGIGGGTAQVQTATIPLLITGYVPGMEVTYIATVSNTDAAPTVNINSFGAKAIIRGSKGASSTALVANDITAGLPVHIKLDATGTYFWLMNPQN